MPSPVRQRDARTLRVLIDAPLDARRECAWALFEGDGRCLETGRGELATWPHADRREAVLGADAVRMIALALPPLPRDRLLAAATFALEERLATSPDDALVAIGESDGRGHVVASVTSRELGRSLLDVVPAFTRAVAEPQLADPVEGWRWCEGEDSAFVRTGDGGSFAVGRAAPAELPAELVLALAHAAREQRAPSQVVVDRAADAEALQRWSSESGVRFAAGTPWSWHAQPDSAYRSATDVLGAMAPSSSRPALRVRPVLAVAGTIAVIALALHVVAGIGTWLWQRVELSRAQRELVTVAQQAGARNVDGANAATALATLHATALHRAGREAPVDAMPLFARAAPALAALPAGTLRTATWSGGAWTLELGALDDAALASLVARTRSAGLAPLHARTTNGVRLRLTPAS
jgi:hypothetical protein